MNMINVTLVGNLVRDPQQHSFASGKIKTTMHVAVSSILRKDDGVPQPPDYYKVEVWGKLAELTVRYLAKGHQVGVSGRLIMERWLDREGRERLTPVIAASQIQFPPRSSRFRSDSNAFSPADADIATEDHVINDDFRPEVVRTELLGNARVVSVGEAASIYRPFRVKDQRRA